MSKQKVNNLKFCAFSVEPIDPKLQTKDMFFHATSSALGENTITSATSCLNSILTQFKHQSLGIAQGDLDIIYPDFISNKEFKSEWILAKNPIQIQTHVLDLKNSNTFQITFTKTNGLTLENVTKSNLDMKQQLIMTAAKHIFNSVVLDWDPFIARVTSILDLLPNNTSKYVSLYYRNDNLEIFPHGKFKQHYLRSDKTSQDPIFIDKFLSSLQKYAFYCTHGSHPLLFGEATFKYHSFNYYCNQHPGKFVKKLFSTRPVIHADLLYDFEMEIAITMQVFFDMPSLVMKMYANHVHEYPNPLSFPKYILFLYMENTDLLSGDDVEFQLSLISDITINSKYFRAMSVQEKQTIQNKIDQDWKCTRLQYDNKDWNKVAISGLESEKVVETDYLYHSTTLLAANSIRSNGIDVNKCQGMGNYGPGFSVSYSKNYSVKWAQRKRKQYKKNGIDLEMALLLFEKSIDDPLESPFNVLQLDEQRVLQEYQSNQKEEYSNEYLAADILYALDVTCKTACSSCTKRIKCGLYCSKCRIENDKKCLIDNTGHQRCYKNGTAPKQGKTAGDELHKRLAFVVELT